MSKIRNKVLRHLNRPRIYDHRITLQNFLNFHKKGNRDDILVFANARGGSSWIHEVIASQKGLAGIFEPFSWQNKRVFAGLDSNPGLIYLYTGEDLKEKLKAYFDAIFDNRITLHFPLNIWNKAFTFRPHRYVFKILQYKHMINWFQNCYNVRIVYFLRNPIPTVLSRIALRWNWINRNCETLVNSREFTDYADADLVDYANKKLKSEDLFERYFTGWCIENYVPLVHLDQSKWTFIHYEKLVADPGPLCRSLITELKLTDAQGMLNIVHQPSQSKSAHSDSLSQEKNLRIHGWRRKVSNIEVTAALQILERFNINDYAHDIRKGPL